LMVNDADVALVVDRDWRRRYVSRTLHLESQADKVVVDRGCVIDVGKHILSNDAYGEFIGLAKFSQEAARLMCDRYFQIRKSYLIRSFHTASNIRTAYFYDMVQELVDLGVLVESVDIQGGWDELDTPQDKKRVQQWLGSQTRLE